MVIFLFFLSIGANASQVSSVAAGTVTTPYSGTVTATEFIASGETASRACYFDSNKQLTSSATVSDTELGYLDGVTSAIQTQFTNKLGKAGNETITNATNSNVGLTVKAAASQSANIQNWTSSVNAELASVGPTGRVNGLDFFAGSTLVYGAGGISLGGNHRLFVNLTGDNTQPMFEFTDLGSLGITYYSSMVQVLNKSADLPAFNIRGAGSQTAALQTWQTSVPATLLSITANGSILGAGAQTISGVLKKQVASTTTTLTIAQCGSTIVSDSTDVITLPEASTGLGCRFTFVCGTTDDFDVNPNGASDVIGTILTTAAGVAVYITPSAGDAIRCTDLGSTVTLEAVGADLWVAVGASNGPWTDVN